MTQRTHPVNLIQILPDLPRLEDSLDLRDKPGKFPGKLRIFIRCLNKIHQLFTDQVAEGFWEAISFLDALRGITLVDPDFVIMVQPCLDYKSQIFVAHPWPQAELTNGRYFHILREYSFNKSEKYPVKKTNLSIKEVEQAIQSFEAEDQKKLLKDLPKLLKISRADLELLKMSETAFSFWENSEDQIYDNL